MDASWREYYSKINKYIKKCWVFKPEIIDFYNENYGRKINDGSVTIGVALREEFSVDTAPRFTGEGAKKMKEHPLTIGVGEVIELVREHMAKWSADKVFLSTLMEESVDQFVEAFGESVIYVDRKRYSVGKVMQDSKLWDKTPEEQHNELQSMGGEKHRRDITVPYVYEVLGLSECDYFIGAKASGSAAAMALNGGMYKDIYILPDSNGIKRY